MVLLFHADVSWMRGGYFGVSVFFTLSGFLITSLLVHEIDSTGRVAIGSFYSRRLRRLLPASIVCLAAVCVLAAFGVWDGVEHLRRDVLGAVFQIANWVQLFAGESYTDLQSKRAGLVSPLEHYWSLAIEEQFYWLWPFAFWGLIRLARRIGRSRLTVLVTMTALFALAAPLIAIAWGTDATYWASPARAAEILVGASLAVAMQSGRMRARSWMAPVGLLGVSILSVALPSTGGPAYHGAFPALALVTALLLLGLQRRGWVTSLLSVRPIVAVGAISYGLYLYHFPIFVLLTDDRTGLSGATLLALRLVVTIAVSWVSSRLIERPVRFGHWSIRRTVSLSALATAATCSLVLLVPSRQDTNYFVPDSDLATAAAIEPTGGGAPLVPLAADPAQPPTPTTSAAPASSSAAPSSPSGPETESSPVRPAPSTTIDPLLAPVAIPPLNRPVRIVVIGDSTALAMGSGMVRWAAENPTIAQVSIEALNGCPLLRGGLPADDPFEADCAEHLDHDVPRALAALQPDVVMLMVTVGDIVPRRWNASEGTVDPADPTFVAHLQHDYQAITDVIEYTTDARIVWIRSPNYQAYWLGEPTLDNSFLAVRNESIARTVASNDETSELLALDDWMAANGLLLDHAARPDGLHFTEQAAYEVTTDWLGPRLVLAATHQRPTE